MMLLMHTQRPFFLPLLYLPVVARSRSAAPYWAACCNRSFNQAVRRAGTQGTCHLTLQPWGGSFSKWPLSICLNANVWWGRFLDYLHLQSRLGAGSIRSMRVREAAAPSLLPSAICHQVQRIRCFHVFFLLLFISSCRCVMQCCDWKINMSTCW